MTRQRLRSVSAADTSNASTVYGRPTSRLPASHPHRQIGSCTGVAGSPFCLSRCDPDGARRHWKDRTLALEVARRVRGEFADGGWLVELASLSDPHLCQRRWRGAGAESWHPMRSRRSCWPGHRGKAASAGPRQLRTRHRRGGDVGRNLRAPVPARHDSGDQPRSSADRGEHAYRVPPLEVPTETTDGCGLGSGPQRSGAFLSRAKELGCGLRIARRRTCQPIAAICRHLDGIPLAIEFAAARAATIGIER